MPVACAHLLPAIARGLLESSMEFKKLLGNIMCCLPSSPLSNTMFIRRQTLPDPIAFLLAHLLEKVKRGLPIFQMALT